MHHYVDETMDKTILTKTFNCNSSLHSTLARALTSGDETVTNFDIFLKDSLEKSTEDQESVPRRFLAAVRSWGEMSCPHSMIWVKSLMELQFSIY